MSKKRLEGDWNLNTSIDLSVNLKRYTRFLEDQGFRDSTIDLDDFAYIMSLNVYGPLIAMQSAIPIIRRQGSGTIVNISSQVARATYPGLLGLCGHEICTHNDLSHCTQRAGRRRHYSIGGLSQGGLRQIFASTRRKVRRR